MRQARKPACRRPALVLLVALAIALVGSAYPGRAEAGEFTIDACQADAGNFASGAFENFATRGMRWRRACNPLGPGLRGLVTANVTRGRPRGQRSAIGLRPRRAPGHLVLAAALVGSRASARLPLRAAALRRARRRHPGRDQERPRQPPLPRRRARAGLELAPAAHYELAARPGSSSGSSASAPPRSQYCSAPWPQLLRDLHRRSDGRPTHRRRRSRSSGRAAGTGRMGERDQSLGYEASDNVGVKGTYAEVERCVPDGHELRACDYANESLSKRTWPDRAWIPARSPKANSNCTSPRKTRRATPPTRPRSTVRIDNTPPGAVPVGSTAAKPGATETTSTLAWEDPPNPTARRSSPPITRLCLGGWRANARPALAQNPSRLAIDGLAVPAPGEWEPSLWREDAAGNQQPANASVPVKLRYDPEPPTLGFEPALAPTTPRASPSTSPIQSRGSAGGEIEISRVGSGVWQELPTTPGR